MQTATIFAVSIFLAFLTESMVEFVFGEIANHVPKLEPYKWLLMYVSMGVGLVLSFHYQIDLVATLIRILGDTHPDEWHGLALSGLAIGRGANYIHQLISTYFPKPAVRFQPNNPMKG